MPQEILSHRRRERREVRDPASPPRSPRLRERTRALKALLWVLCLLPLALLVWDGFTDGLGAEPIENLTHRTGWWGLTLLLVTLAVTPVRRLTGWNRLIQLRRPLGLFAFFYVCLHFLIYLFDQDFTLAFVTEDVVKRPYITVGFTAFLLLIPLAVTSTKGMIRRLGKRWQRLHRLVYVVAGLGVLHFLWLVKADLREPLLFGVVLAVLLAFRLRRAEKRPGRGGEGVLRHG